MALTDKLTAIGDAIRGKTGGSSLLSLDDMATAIGNISGGEVETLPENMVHFTGRGDNLFIGQLGKRVLKDHINEITFTDMQDMPYAFAGELGNIYVNSDIGMYDYPKDLSSLDIYFKDNTGSTDYNGYIDLKYMFNHNNQVRYLPKFHFTNTGVYKCNNIFGDATSLLSVDDFMNSLIFLDDTYANCANMFQHCYCLKNIPHLEKLKTRGRFTSIYGNGTIYSQGFQSCYELQELLNLPVFSPAYSQDNTGNLFYYSFDYCSTLSRLVFNTNNGTPIVARWSNQNINLGSSTNKRYVGYFENTSKIQDSNIPFVKNQETYEQYKNGVYHTTWVQYSRYNHDSAVETINSLPDTSAVSNGTNQINFLGDSGSYTDGGAISNLTAAEIKVATDKGWTVNIT